jgi:predicted N-acetyltransferase YhbS
MDIIIKNENKNDHRIVEELTREAFWNLYVPGCSEHFLLHNLRKSKDFIRELDFIAEKDGRIIGNIVYTRGIIKTDYGTEKEVICFGPVSVLPAFQKQGIGSALINHSIKIAKGLGYQAIFIYGDPRYYCRFGFRCAEKYDIKTADGKFAYALLALELQPGALNNMPGRFIESATFEVDESKLGEFDKTFPAKEKTITDSQREFAFMASMRY